MNELAIGISTTARHAGEEAPLLQLAASLAQIEKEDAIRRQGIGVQTGIVLVEDSDDDAQLFALGVRRACAGIIVQRASDAVQARQLLAGYRPSLIVLDCHLPGEGGLDLLREIKSLESYRMVPIVMMSGSESDADVQMAYDFGANSFVRKPYDCHEYVKRVRQMLEYWLEGNYTLEHQLPIVGNLYLG